MNDKIIELNSIFKSFKIKATCLSHRQHRNISIYDISLDPGSRIKNIQKFSCEIALALKSKTIPLIKPIIHLGIVRMELAVEDSQKINFFDKICSIERPSGVLPFYFGEGMNGNDIWIDMAYNPHMLIAGSTGSGKSTLLHSIIANSLLFSNVLLFLTDTKNIEFSQYTKYSNRKVTVATNFKDSLNQLKFLVEEMNARYDYMKNNNLPGSYFYNCNPIFPYLIFVIDEFSDLILQDSEGEYLSLLLNLTQKSRAAGIYCVLATQRPTTGILNGNIKANFPARLSCKVSSNLDSRIVLDEGGAENLNGMGDSIIKNNVFNMERFQAPYICADEILRVIRPA